MRRYTNHPLEREAVKMKATRLEVLRATYLAWMRVFGVRPTRGQLALKVAHWAYETGWFVVGFWCWNLGNEKTSPDSNPHCYFRCGETENGKTVYYDPPHIQTCFKAFATLEEGVAAALAFLGLDTTPNNGRPNKYEAAWNALLAEQVALFVAELDRQGYFTADPGVYLRGVDGCLRLLLESGLVDQVIAEFEGVDYIENAPPIAPPTSQVHSPATSDDIAIAWAEMPVPWGDFEEASRLHNLDMYDRRNDE